MEAGEADCVGSSFGGEGGGGVVLMGGRSSSYKDATGDEHLVIKFHVSVSLFLFGLGWSLMDGA